MWPILREAASRGLSALADTLILFYYNIFRNHNRHVLLICFRAPFTS